MLSSFDMICFELLLTILCINFGTSRPWVIETVPTKNKAPWHDGNDLKEMRGERVNLIFPGTKWCGSGSIAENPEDLGHFADTDACCRTHDQCDDTIEAMQTKHNLTNPTFYTRVHCSCDEKFYDCLHRSEDKAGPQIGTLYFSVLNTKCFRNDYPILGCKRYTKFPRRCVEYELDESQEKIYQWFDVPLY